MSSNLIDQAKELLQKAESLLSNISLSPLTTQLKSLEEQTLGTDFWQSPDAQSVMGQISLVKKEMAQIQEVKTIQADIEAILELTGQTEDKNLESELESSLRLFKKVLQVFELNQFLKQKFDKKGAILSIHPGQGGTEACDWASMLSRMYQRYFERKDWKFSIASHIMAETAGIKEVSFEINAPYAYGYLKREAGTHRLVRLSPFNADSLRQTSFALVEVLPLLEDDSEIEIKDHELEWHFTRAGGAGGQNVNKVNTAVELTHLPTCLVVKCREERSQAQNKEKALKILRAKLAKTEEEKLDQELAQEKGEHKNASWGNQIRNYVLHPYQLVKDTRTETETSDTAGVLDGDLDEFIFAEIKL